MEKEENLVVLNSVKSIQSSSGDTCDSNSLLSQKIDKLNKDNSVLKDQLAEKNGSLMKVDGFYKEILQQKDQIINDLQLITSNDGEIDTKFKRLLLKFRSDQELKAMIELKAVVAGDAMVDQEVVVSKTDRVNVGTGTESEVVQCNCHKTVPLC